MLYKVLFGVLLFHACAPYERYKNPQQTPVQETPGTGGDQFEEGVPTEEQVNETVQLRAGELVTVSLKIDLDVTIDGLVEIVGYDRIAPIMGLGGAGSCASSSCHGGFNPREGLNLSKRPFVWANSPYVTEEQIVERMIMVMRRERRPMPPRPRDRLPEEDIKLFDNWLANGLPNESSFKDQNNIQKPTAKLAKIIISEIDETSSVVGEPRIFELERSTAESTNFNSVFLAEVPELKHLHKYKLEMTFVSSPDVELKSVIQTIQIEGKQKQLNIKEFIPAELALTLD